VEDRAIRNHVAKALRPTQIVRGVHERPTPP
jgi:hypothetical protein